MKASLPRARAAKLATRTLPQEDPEFQIAPMIDILLVLLVFFMAIATDQVTQASDGLLLPTAKLETPPEISSESTLSLHWTADGSTTSVDQAGSLDQPALVAYLKNRRAKAGDQPYRVVIRADKRVPYRDVRAAMSALGQAGLANVIFSVADRDEP